MSEKDLQTTPKTYTRNADLVTTNLNLDRADKKLRTIVSRQINMLMRRSRAGMLDREQIALLQTCQKLVADFRRDDKEFAAKVPTETLTAAKAGAQKTAV